MLNRKFRIIPMGVRKIMGLLVPSGWRFEEFDFETNNWIYIDILPPDLESAKSYTKSVKGTLLPYIYYHSHTLN